MQRHEAEENLRVIRSLMEKATIYRAISAPTALVGGLASIACAICLAFQSGGPGVPADEQLASRSLHFLIGWGLVIFVTGVANTILLRRDAKRQGAKFVSSGMKHALLGMFPSILCGAGLTFVCILTLRFYLLPPMWMLCYALALLATKGFAPRSILVLGWVFFAAGFVAVCIATWPMIEGRWNPTVVVSDVDRTLQISNLMMASTFGIFHLIYAALTWRRGGAQAATN